MSRSVRLPTVRLVALASLFGVVSMAGASEWTIETAKDSLLGPSCSLALGAGVQPVIAHNGPGLTTKTNGDWMSEFVVESGSAFASLLNARQSGDTREIQLLYYTVPAIAINGEGTVRVVFEQVADEESPVWAAVRGGDGGWTIDPLAAHGHLPTLALDSAGDPHVSLGDYYGNVVYARSDGAGGYAFETIASGFHPSIAIDAQDRVSVALGGGAGLGLRYGVRGADGWSLDSLTKGLAAWSPSLALDPVTGEPRISFYDPASAHFKFAWRSGTSWTIEPVAPGEVASSLALNPQGDAFIAYQAGGGTNRDLGFAHRVNGFWITELVDTEGDTGHHPSLALDQNGRPCIAYLDPGAQRLRYAVGAPTVGVSSRPTAPAFAIAGVRPLPVRSGGSLWFSLRLPDARQVALGLYDVAGRRVGSRAPVSLPAGSHQMSWPTSGLVPGLYLLHATTERGETFAARLAVL